MFRRVKRAKDEHSEEEAYAYALRLLEFRFRGEEELRARLKEKGFTSMVIASTLEKLSRLKYVDDNRLLEGLIREYREFGLYGPAYIKQKLMQRKFGRTEIDEAVRSFYAVTDEKQALKKFIAKQKHIDLSDPKDRQRLIQRCMRRGFTAGLVFKSVDQTLEDS